MEVLVAYFSNLPGPIIYLAAFAVLLACGLGVPIPEDITLFTMGLLSYYTLVDVNVSILVCLAGVLIGDSLIFYFGYRYGPRLAKKGIFAKMLSPERMKIAKEKFRKKGPKVILAARFMPGLRAPTYFSAGTLDVPFSTFIFYDGLAAILSVPALVSVVYFLGDKVDYAIGWARKVQHGITLTIVVIILILIAKYFISKRMEKKRA